MLRSCNFQKCSFIFKLESRCQEMNLGFFKTVRGGQLLNLGGFAGFFALLLSQSTTSFLFRHGKSVILTATKFCSLLGKTVGSSPALALFNLP